MLTLDLWRRGGGGGPSSGGGGGSGRQRRGGGGGGPSPGMGCACETCVIAAQLKPVVVRLISKRIETTLMLAGKGEIFISLFRKNWGLL